MSKGRSQLGDFSDAELIEELARRKNQVEPEQIKHWCNDCKNFVIWKGDERKMPESYNPCSKKHVMSFRVPGMDEDPYTEDCGFYRVVCEDRNEQVSGSGIAGKN